MVRIHEILLNMDIQNGIEGEADFWDHTVSSYPQISQQCFQSNALPALAECRSPNRQPKASNEGDLAPPLLVGSLSQGKREVI